MDPVLATAFFSYVLTPLLLLGAGIGVHKRLRPNINTMKGNRLFQQMMRWKDDDKRWKKHVGMTYECFVYVLGLLKEDPTLQVERPDRAVPLEERFLGLLVMFRNGYSQSTMAPCTGHGHSQQSVSFWMKLLIPAILKLRRKSGMYLPTDLAELKAMALTFERWGRSRIPNCVGAIDATHIHIQHNQMQYMCRKGSKTINIQVICDGDRKIRDIFDERGAMPGSINDQMMYAWSNAHNWIAQLPLMGLIMVSHLAFGFFIAADGGYANRPGCISPFVKPRDADQLPAEHRDFNFWHSSLRMIVEQCFGNLKGRWQILNSFHRLPYAPDQVLEIFTCCAILQNFCIDFEGPEMRRDIATVCFSESMSDMNDVGFDDCNSTIDEKERGEQLRSALCTHLHQVHSGVYDITNDITFDQDLQGNI